MASMDVSADLPKRKETARAVAVRSTSAPVLTWVTLALMTPHRTGPQPHPVGDMAERLARIQ